jgi:hypothetical protein
MTSGEIIYLLLLLGTFCGFAGVLAFLTWEQRPRTQSGAGRTPPLAAGSAAQN